MGNPPKSDALVAADLRDAYKQIVAHGGKVDILYMSACLLGSIEMGYQARDFVDYYVASETLGWAAGYPGYLWAITPDLKPVDLATRMAESYDQQTATEPHTISVAKLANVTLLKDKVSRFAGLLKTQMMNSGNADLLKQTYAEVQRFETDGGWISTDDLQADLYDVASIVKQKTGDSGLQGAAQDVMDVIAGPEATRYILYERHLSGWRCQNKFLGYRVAFSLMTTY